MLTLFSSRLHRGEIVSMLWTDKELSWVGALYCHDASVMLSVADQLVCFHSQQMDLQVVWLHANITQLITYLFVFSHHMLLEGPVGCVSFGCSSPKECIANQSNKWKGVWLSFNRVPSQLFPVDQWEDFKDPGGFFIFQVWVFQWSNLDFV